MLLHFVEKIVWSVNRLLNDNHVKCCHLTEPLVIDANPATIPALQTTANSYLNISLILIRFYNIVASDKQGILFNVLFHIRPVRPPCQ